eukprot:Gregarina_sp_Poly_1__8286@NODE_483_length_8026_cov_108_655610_g390_i0_p1_GENE_NODE_483_length_8026_cov_108_655610_g390_i0NODE_483_length_8026_cov_108_655610_g390_i0_p1_ORF_typecomplete_len788_score81_22_NODE_483_length_8026_cov_108_655610_g390_i055917954
MAQLPFLDIALPPDFVEHQATSFRFSNVVGPKSDDSSSKSDRYRPEWPRLMMRHRSFVFASLAEFQWTLQIGYSDVTNVHRAQTPCVSTAVFSTRHCRLRIGENALCDYSRKNESLSLLEVFISRGLELEADLRSRGSIWTYVPRIKGKFAWECPPPEKCASPQHAFRSCSFDSPDFDDNLGFNEFEVPDPQDGDHRRACTLQPAILSRVADPGKINVHVSKADGAALNELRWLLATIVNVDSATIFTQIVESRQIKSFNIVVDDCPSDTLPDIHKFVLTEPWRTAWEWVDRLKVDAAEISRVYLAVVGLTWAPVPVAPEASWIYELSIVANGRDSENPSLAIDVSRPSELSNPIVKYSIQRGFPEFLWNVIRFWQGISSPLDRTGLATAPNEDLAAMISLNLKRLGSRYMGEGWMSNEVPIGALVAAAWDEINWKHHLMPYEANDMKIIIPPRVETSLFIVNPEIVDQEKAKADMFVNGYKLFVQGESKFRLGISSAGLILSTAFFIKDIADRNKRQRQTWLFDMCRNGVIPSPSLAILILACHGVNISANYDEKYARCFMGMYPFAAVCEYPRSCTYQSLRTKQHRLEFRLINPKDPRGFELWTLLKNMDQNEGLIHLQCSTQNCVLAASDQWPTLISYMTRPLAVPTRRSLISTPFQLGWLQMDQISPGLYAVKDLPTGVTSSKTDSSKARFCHQTMRPTDVVEVVAHKYGPVLQTLDVEPIFLPTGMTIESVDINYFRQLQLPTNPLSVRAPTRDGSRQRFSAHVTACDDSASASTVSPVSGA